MVRCSHPGIFPGRIKICARPLADFSPPPVYFNTVRIYSRRQILNFSFRTGRFEDKSTSKCIFGFYEKSSLKVSESIQKGLFLFQINEQPVKCPIKDPTWKIKRISRKKEQQSKRYIRAAIARRIIRSNSINVLAFCVSVVDCARVSAVKFGSVHGIIKLFRRPRLYGVVAIAPSDAKNRLLAAVSSPIARIVRSCLARGWFAPSPPSQLVDSRENKFCKMPARGRLNTGRGNFGNTLRPACDPIFVKYERYGTRARGILGD